ncbi:MAG: hypothetical protein LBG45_12765 [Dysgonamonadaceae bacterium]|jgi:hypothetical protein|nr:hypothetical protein [Dysgonamonadaceae bacterium]
MTGLLAGHGGYLPGYDIYEGNTYEEDTLISFIKKINERFSLGKPIVIASKTGQKKDRHNREKGLKRIEKRIKSGKLTKENINNRGYNKYLKLEGEINVSIDGSVLICS